jgi:hypothetical protein
MLYILNGRKMGSRKKWGMTEFGLEELQHDL